MCLFLEKKMYNIYFLDHLGVSLTHRPTNHIININLKQLELGGANLFIYIKI